MAILRHVQPTIWAISLPQKAPYHSVASYDTQDRGGTILKPEPHSWKAMQGKEAHILEVIKSPAYPSKQKKFKMAANIINVKFYLTVNIYKK